MIETINTPPPPVIPTEERPYRPYGAAMELLKSRANEVLLSGPAGTGKSRACLEKLHACAEKYPGMRGLIVRKTRASLTEAALVTLEDHVIPAGHSCLEGASRKMRQGYTYPNGSVIIVGGIDKASKVMSTEYDLIYVQEAIELSEVDWESLTTRLRNGKVPFQQLLADTNPDAPGHWLKRRCDSGRTQMIACKHEDNPTLWNHAKKEWTPKGQKYIFEVLESLTGPRKARLRDGRWVQAEGVVYDGYSAAIHLVDRFDIPREWPRFLVVDFGFTNPFVAQWWAADPDGRIFRYREIYKTQRLVEDHAKRIAELQRGEPELQAIICDHDAEGRATIERHLGYATWAAKKEVREGIQAVAVRLKVLADGKPRLFLMRDSLDERDGTLHDAKRPCCTEEEFDCLIPGTLIETESGSRLIERIREGDRLWTRDGLKHVRVAKQTYRTAQIVLAVFSNGSMLAGTGKHPVFVRDKGWVSLASISYADIIEGWKRPSSTSTGSPTAGIQKRRIGHLGTISVPPHLTSLEDTAACMLTYGGQFMAMCPKVGTFITETATRSTTPSITSNVSALKSMRMLIEETRSGGRRRGWQNLTQQESFQQIGGQRRRMEDGARQSGPEPNGSERRREFAPANNAAKAFAAGASKRCDFVRENAIPHFVVPLERLLNPEPARLAATCSTSISGRKNSVAPVHALGVFALPIKMPVFNLSVEDCPEYYANGILVHNCYVWDTKANRKQGEEPVKLHDHGMDAMRYAVRYADDGLGMWNFGTEEDGASLVERLIDRGAFMPDRFTPEENQRWHDSPGGDDDV